MDVWIQAIVLGIVQGLTEFLPISSSAHLLALPILLGWRDPFIGSLLFDVLLHLGTLVALLIYFRSDWLRLVPAALAALRERSFAGDPDRRLAWLLVVTTIPASIAGLVLNDSIETAFREVRLVALTMVAGAAILWLAERWGSGRLDLGGVSFPVAFSIGVAQALALVPGISRSGISISAGMLAGLRRESAARFSFLMATPITALAVAWEVRKLLVGEAGVAVPVGPLLASMVAAWLAGMVAIGGLLRFLRTQPTTVFAIYRVLFAGLILVWWLGLGR